MAITKLKVEMMNKELAEMLEAFATKHGLSKGNQRISYNDATFKFTAEFGDKSTTGDANPIYYKDLVRNGFMYGLSKDDMNKPVKTGKGVMHLRGMRGKYAILQSADMKFWKYDPVVVATLLKAA